jgi:predicted DNA-binding protein
MGCPLAVTDRARFLADLERLVKRSSATSRTEASLLREALDDLLYKHRDTL